MPAPQATAQSSPSLTFAPAFWFFPSLTSLFCSLSLGPPPFFPFLLSVSGREPARRGDALPSRWRRLSAAHRGALGPPPLCTIRPMARGRRARRFFLLTPPSTHSLTPPQWLGDDELAGFLKNIIFSHMGEMGSPHMGKKGCWGFLRKQENSISDMWEKWGRHIWKKRVVGEFWFVFFWHL